MNISAIYEYLNLLAPFKTALSWDNSGLLVGNILDEFKCGLICLDVTNKIVEEAISKKCNLIISHHPIIFNKLNKITTDMLVYKLIKNNISVISLHTNLDIAKDGVNFALAKKLELTHLSPLFTDVNKTTNFNYKLIVFVPCGYQAKVKESIFKAGAGTIGNYTECCFTSKGIGEFKPIDSATPFIGQTGNLEAVDEIKIEVLVAPEYINSVVNAMLQAHPYEEPAYEFSKIYNNYNCESLGLVGNLNKEYSPKDFATIVKNKLNCKKVSYVAGNKNIKRVAVCGGSGAEFVKNAVHKHADAYITSEIKHNIWLEAKNLGLTLIDAGHFNTENVIVEELANKLNKHFNTSLFSAAENNVDIVNVI